MKKYLNNSGFTLIEMMATITIIALLYILVFPTVLEFLKRTSGDIDEINRALITIETEKYIDNNPSLYPKISGDTYCITVGELIDAGYLGDFLYDTEALTPMGSDQIIEASVDGDIFIDLVDTCEETATFNTYFDSSGANPPVLYGNLIPVYWNDGWITADITNSWYNYKNKEWANAVLVDSSSREIYVEGGANIAVLEEDILAQFVWIPRYRYNIFNSLSVPGLTPRSIEIEFESTLVDKSRSQENFGWKTHPAFTHDERELSGVWIGKYTTAGSAVAPLIKPNHTMITNLNAFDQFEASKQIGIENYGLNRESKMMNNLEWGAIAFLSHSKYGFRNEVWINANSNFTTGCAFTSVNSAPTTSCNLFETVNGMNASTTGNVYGVYDMAGGSWERVLGVMQDASGDLIPSSSGFSTLINQEEYRKYINEYEYDTSSSTISRRLLGDATGETVGWYGNTATMPNGATSTWFVRGGDYTMGAAAGLFTSASDDGTTSSAGFRIVIPAY